MTLYDFNPDMLDMFSFCWGAGWSLIVLAIIKSIVQVIRLIINFIKWLIKRKDV